MIVSFTQPPPKDTWESTERISFLSFEKTYSDKLLGPAWRVCLSDLFEDFRERRRGKESEETLKAEFAKQALEGFYSAMDYVFREGFGTDSQTAKHVINGLSELIFGKA